MNVDLIPGRYVIRGRPIKAARSRTESRPPDKSDDKRRSISNAMKFANIGTGDKIVLERKLTKIVFPLQEVRNRGRKIVINITITMTRTAVAKRKATNN